METRVLKNDVAILALVISLYVQVKAVDNGRPQKKAKCQVLFTVVATQQESSNPPHFEQKGVMATVMENDDVGHLVAIMVAKDNDSSVWYAISGTFCCRFY